MSTIVKANANPAEGPPTRPTSIVISNGISAASGVWITTQESGVVKSRMVRAISSVLTGWSVVGVWKVPSILLYPMLTISRVFGFDGIT